MRILLKLTLDGDVDAAWRALHSPAVMSELYGPLLRLDPLSSLPTAWESGDDAAVRMRAGTLALGTLLIAPTDRTREHRGRSVRILRDSGTALTGPLATLDVWDHQVAVSATDDDPARTLWRERLVIAGRTAPALWPALWAAWQWRGQRIRALAPTWGYEPTDTDRAGDDDARG